MEIMANFRQHMYIQHFIFKINNCRMFSLLFLDISMLFFIENSEFGLPKNYRTSDLPRKLEWVKISL